MIRQVAAADVLVQQIFDFSPQMRGAAPVDKSRCHTFPYVGGIFLWPLSTEDHPSNEPHRLTSAGPYPREISDSFLNKMLREGVPGPEAAQRYLDADIIRLSRFDRTMELHLERQRQRDEICDMNCADYILAHFRRTKLFMTKGHLELPMFAFVVRHVFDKLGVPHSLTLKALRSLRHAPFGLQDAPIHPRIAEYLGLSYGGIDDTYRFYNEGRYNFLEYSQRYVDYVWDPKLREAVFEAGVGQEQHWLSVLDEALSRCSRSDTGWRKRAALLARLNRFEEALGAIDRAAALEPDDPENPAARARILLQWGRPAEAEQAARAAIDMAPHDAVGHQALAEILAATHRMQAASMVADIAVDLRPADRNLFVSKIGYQSRSGDPAGAERAVRQALQRNPHDAQLRSMLFGLLLQRQQFAEAAEFARQLIEAEPLKAGYHGQAATALMQLGDLAGAETSVRRAIELDGKNTEFQHQLVEILSRRGCYADAIDAARALVQRHPQRAVFITLLASLLRRNGELVEAELAYREAIRLDANLLKAQWQLAELLESAGRIEDAVAVLRPACDADRPNAGMLERLFGVLWRAGDLVAAEAAIRRAIAVEPQTARFRILCAAFLRSLDRHGEACAVLREGIDAGIRNAEIYREYATSLDKLGQLDEAFAAMRTAHELAPDNAHIRAVFAHLERRHAVSVRQPPSEALASAA